jgi:hypothetical protein
VIMDRQPCNTLVGYFMKVAACLAGISLNRGRRAVAGAPVVSHVMPLAPDMGTLSELSARVAARPGGGRALERRGTCPGTGSRWGKRPGVAGPGCLFRGEPSRLTAGR